MTDMNSKKPKSTGTDTRRVLTIDDDVGFSRALMAALQANGYEVLGENDSRKALEVAQRFHPDLIVLDMCMPNYDGGDVAQQLREQPDTRDIPIIFLTSIIEPEEAARMTAEGQEFMSKPVRVADLVQRIEKCL